jgi:hypothetical protein
MKFRWLLTLAMAALPAAAQVGEFSVNFGQSLFRNEKLGTTEAVESLQNLITARDGFRTSLRFTVNTGTFIGHEFNYGYTRSKIRLDNQDYSTPTHQYGYNFLFYPVPIDLPVRPFFTAGGGFSSYYPPGSSAFQGNGITKFGVNYGAGVKIRVSPMFHVRVDVRDYINGKPLDLFNQSGILHMIEASAGFGIHF